MALLTGRWLRRLRAALWLTILLAAPPIALIWYIGWPLPRHLPARSEWGQFLAQPVTRANVIDLFAIAVWLMWAALVYALLADITARIRRLRRGEARLRLPPLPAALQATANGLLGAAVFGTGTATAATGSPPHAPTPAVAPHLPGHPADLSPAAETAEASGPPSRATAEGMPWVLLPDDGGWLTHHTATAVAASAALVWRQRRRRYIPRPLTGRSRDDPDLIPLSTAATAVQARLQPPPDQPPDPAAGPAVDLRVADTATAGVTVGYATSEALPPADLPTGGVGLTGPAATDAARGALVATLLPTTATGIHPRVVTTTACLRALLGPHAHRVADTPGLHLADDLPAALRLTERVALTRAAALTPTPTNPPPTPADTFPLLLIAEAPTDPDTAQRLAMLLTFAAAHHITGVLLGPWRLGRTWTIHPGGAVQDADGAPRKARFSTLSPVATADLLILCRQAHQPPPPCPVAPHPPAGRSPGEPHTHPPAGGARATGMLRLRILGPPALFAPGTDSPLRIPRSAALPILVLLTLHPSGLTTRELATALWPAQHPNTLARRIYTTISALGKTINPIAGGPVIIHADERYRLNPPHLHVDLWQLQDAIDIATTAATTTEQITALQQVLDHYQDELAAGWPWPWLDPPREALRRQVIDAHVTLADRQPDPAQSQAVLRAALRIAPDNDELRRRVSAHTALDPRHREH